MLALLFGNFFNKTCLLYNYTCWYCMLCLFCMLLFENNILFILLILINWFIKNRLLYNLTFSSNGRMKRNRVRHSLFVLLICCFVRYCAHTIPLNATFRDIPAKCAKNDKAHHFCQYCLCHSIKNISNSKKHFCLWNLIGSWCIYINWNDSQTIFVSLQQEGGISNKISQTGKKQNIFHLIS